MSSSNILLDNRMKIYIFAIMGFVVVSLILLLLNALGFIPEDYIFFVSAISTLLGLIVPGILVGFMISYKRNKEFIID